MRRYLVALTAAELGALRAPLCVEVDNGSITGAELAVARRALAALDAAVAVTGDDVAALESAAGQMLIDAEEWESWRRSAGVRGDAYRARDAIRSAMRRRR